MNDKRSMLDKKMSRWTALKTERSEFDTLCREISQNILPKNGRFTSSDRNKKKKYNSIYDSTGTKALRTLGAGLMGGATSPARPWFRLAIPDKDLMKYAPVKRWLSDTTKDMFDIFQKSNTYRSLHGYYEELGAFGTAAGFLMDDFEKVVHHYTMSAGEYAIATDYKGNVNTLYREFDKTVSELVLEFGYDRCSTRVRNMYDNGNYDTPVTIIHALEPRFDRDMTKRDAVNLPYQSCYFEAGGGKKQNGEGLLRDGGMKRFRGVCPRWTLLSGDVYGTSPAMEALGDVKQLQHQQLRKAQAIDYMTNPPLQVPSSYQGHEGDSLPGGRFVVDQTGAHNSVKTAFDVRLDLNHLLADIQDVRKRIESAFYSDLFLMIANDTRSGVTATEIAERHEEKLLMLGPVLERLHNELLAPMIDITFDRMIESGSVAPPPEELQNMPMSVEFVSMLAQAQKAVATNSVDRFVGNIGMIAQMKPEVLDKIDADYYADHYSDMLGVDPELIIGNDKVAVIRQERQQAMQAQQQAAMIEQSANAANKLGNTPTDGKNALTDVMGMFSGYQSPV